MRRVSTDRGFGEVTDSNEDSNDGSGWKRTWQAGQGAIQGLKRDTHQGRMDSMLQKRNPRVALILRVLVLVAFERVS